MTPFKSVVLLFLLLLYCGDIDAVPLPPHKPVTPVLERFPHIVHLKEESPFYCSRAVSRWVRDAWAATLKQLESTLAKNKLFNLAITEDLLSPTCPFHTSNDMYSKHERAKVKRTSSVGAVECSLCGRKFRSEYYLDRHLDRMHSLQDGEYTLDVNYSGGPVGTIFYRKKDGAEYSFEPAPSQLIPQALRPSGMCLESLCTIFDVCDRPPNAQAPLIYNDLSATYKAPPHAKAVGITSPEPAANFPVPAPDGQYHSHHTVFAPELSSSADSVIKELKTGMPFGDSDSKPDDSRGVSRLKYLHQRHVDEAECQARKVVEAKDRCIHLIDQCFDVHAATHQHTKTPARDERVATIRTANIYLKQHLCGALASCDTYTSRRKFAGSSRKYTEAAFTGTIMRPLTAWKTWEIAFLIAGSVLLISLATLAACCYFTSLSEADEEKRLVEQHRRSRRKSADPIQPRAVRSALEMSQGSPHFRQRPVANAPGAGWSNSQYANALPTSYI